MPALHEALAVEQGLAETANKVTKETAKTLETKRTLFAGMSKEHTIFAEDKQHLKQATEIKEVESTVDEQLDFMSKEVGRYWDIVLQKEEANQRAKADIVVDGKTIASDVPSIVLLSMEKKLSNLMDVYTNLPTQDAAKAWVLDENYAKKGVYRTKNPTERQQTVTTKHWVEISPATKEHKAQVAEQEKTDVIGKYTVTEFSGALTSLNKAEKIGRLSALIRAVKAARQRANATEVKTDITFGTELFKFINNG